VAALAWSTGEASHESIAAIRAAAAAQATSTSNSWTPAAKATLAAAVIAALVALVGHLMTYRMASRNFGDSAWMTRFQEGTKLAFGKDVTQEQRMAAVEILSSLLERPCKSQEDQKMLSRVLQTIMACEAQAPAPTSAAVA